MTHRIGGIETPTVTANKTQDRLREQRLYSLGMSAIGPEGVPQDMLAENKVRARVAYVIHAANVVAEHPGSELPSDIPTTPNAIGAEAAYAVGRILRGQHQVLL